MIGKLRTCVKVVSYLAYSGALWLDMFNSRSRNTVQSPTKPVVFIGNNFILYVNVEIAEAVDTYSVIQPLF